MALLTRRGAIRETEAHVASTRPQPRPTQGLGVKQRHTGTAALHSRTLPVAVTSTRHPRTAPACRKLLERRGGRGH